MSEKKSVNWKLVTIRVAYWCGVVLDFLVALISTISLISMNDAIFVKIFSYRRPSYPLTDLTYAILIFETALMWGWTFLLIWADRKPIERRGILLLTVVPVVGMIVIFSAIGWGTGFGSYIAISTFIILPLIIILYIVSYVFATKLVKSITTNSDSLSDKSSEV